ncbi:hypothetical protein BFW01_g4810 [Lasiodiplodia theobromae]|uniref:Nacht domain protein n=1 Tax=Lasiodiplodia theobromae TaxID=45133 RepID=UPI0015C3C574|nr:Nacht domain protein [Lasiodiplodia theobromae]KAF4542891.1 Nacht domain protein [Lasiodiplodia theobromae]KAF9633915.1 hypothetical protein BFW01_g4810 [Lasiodiplodia theobromae]
MFSPVVQTKGASREAYDKAVDLLQKKYANNGRKLELLKSAYGIEDVLETVTEAQLKYAQRTEGSKVRKWLGGLSTRITYYGQIIDVLSQHHPEYVSLAWGTMKFLFVLVLNHEEMISELAKAVSRIADVLPRAKLQLLAFGTDWMKDATQCLYAEVINLLMRCLEWYEANPWKHAWKAFKDPYKLRFQDLRDKVDEKARRMDEMANTLSQMKINDMHQALVRMENTMSAHHLVLVARISGLEQISQQVQVTQILNGTEHSQFPSPVESLRFCQAVRRKRIGQFELNRTALLPRLQAWSAAESSSLIAIAGAAPTRFQTKDLATELVDLISAANKPVIWVLNGRQPPSINKELTHINLLRQLTNQLVKLNNERMIAHVSANFNAPRVASARCEADWLGILKECLTGLPEVYLVVDMEILGKPSDENADSWLEFFRLLETLVSSVQGVALKVAVLSFRQNFIRSVSMGSSPASIVSLRGANARGGGPGVKRSQPWGERKNKKMRFV